MRFSHTGPAPERRDDWQTLKNLWPYVWAFRGRVLLAFACMVVAKVANVLTPIYLKDLIDALGVAPALLAIPLAALAGYGLARLLTGVFGELRDALFARVTQGAIQQVASQLFAHLLSLSLRFHLGRRTGGLTRDIERGTKGIGFLLNFTVFNILPTLLEIAMVTGVLLWRYDWVFAALTLATIAAYVLFTLKVTERRMVYRRTMNSLDSQANGKAIDALLNYETVKYFGNEAYESRRYDTDMRNWVDSAVRNQVSLNLLNMGQSLIITIGMTALLWQSARGVVQGSMTVGDVVLVSAYLTQLYAPLNFLGFVYREIKHALADMERMFDLLAHQQEVADRPDATALRADQASLSFDAVDFGYQPDRRILHGVSFSVPAGGSLAVVGASGAGKSTLSRLLFRFYDPTGGAVRINGRDVRDYTQDSLRAHIGIVPQDTVLFNDTIGYNIAYGRPDASPDDVIRAAQAAHIHEFVSSLPQGYDTPVGERGLKLSGGEKQRVAIARALLKSPPILVFDEATSALDTRTERAIQDQLERIARGRTTLIIAHRLSTIVHADHILVLDAGRVVEQGSHASLLARGGRYARMWQLQQSRPTDAPGSVPDVADSATAPDASPV
ncbi:ABC transporter ATP-binding protein/permease [uncultured Castellaniella sp.]|uniref:ABCB family ABC transporter ATP-binding protein/permease n=1 Tax=uncultured Castellaniella sp. TaxID=647907 RepID=UPI002637C5C5|nr:ABC transporter ATP-binding protein/permease [uncultured Castellaniella sp.]